MLNVTVTGLAELRAALDGFSDRRFAAAIATALTRTAVAVRDDMRKQLAQDMDRPTPYALAGIGSVPATADKPEAQVRVRDDRASSNGTPPAYFLGPGVLGGKRRQKGFELALQNMGVLPSGWLAVPGQGAPLDSYGNLSRAYIGQILRGLATQSMQGPAGGKDATRRISAMRKAGGMFLVVPVGGKTQPGIYIRDAFGKNITPVLIFVKSATYQKRFRFYEGAEESARKHLDLEVTQSVQEHIARIASKGST
jgi:hypothetical protein